MSISLLPKAGLPGWIVIIAYTLIGLIIVFSAIRVFLKSRRRAEERRAKGL